MLIGAFVGSLSGIAFLFFPATTQPFVPPLASLLNIISFNAYSITVVCANAFLPSLAIEDEQAEVAYKEAHDSERVPLLEDHKAVHSMTLSRISSISFGVGCLSAVIGLSGFETLLYRLNGTNQALQICIGIMGVWWLLFTLPAFYLPSGERSPRGQSLGVTGGWKRVGKLLRPSQIRELPNLYRFLLVWLFLSDGESRLSRNHS